jgi:hypothetical protein
MEYGGSTPFSTTSVQDSSESASAPEGAFPRPPLTTETGTQVVENGIEPPYSISEAKSGATASDMIRSTYRYCPDQKTEGL